MKPWAEKFYQSKAWHKCRDSYIADHPLCERCLKLGDAVPSKIVHHKKWLTPNNINDAEVSLNWDNLESLCQDCHNIEHHGKDDALHCVFDVNGQPVPLPPEK